MTRGTVAPTSREPNTPLYQLIAARLGENPLEFIAARRAQDPPMAFARIMILMQEQCNFRIPKGQEPVYLTAEAPRRWLLWAQAYDEAGHPAKSAP